MIKINIIWIVQIYSVYWKVRNDAEKLLSLRLSSDVRFTAVGTKELLWKNNY